MSLELEYLLEGHTHVSIDGEFGAPLQRHTPTGNDGVLDHFVENDNGLHPMVCEANEDEEIPPLDDDEIPPLVDFESDDDDG